MRGGGEGGGKMENWEEMEKWEWMRWAGRWWVGGTKPIRARSDQPACSLVWPELVSRPHYKFIADNFSIVTRPGEQLQVYRWQPGNFSIVTRPGEQPWYKIQVRWQPGHISIAHNWHSCTLPFDTEVTEVTRLGEVRRYNEATFLFQLLTWTSVCPDLVQVTGQACNFSCQHSLWANWNKVGTFDTIGSWHIVNLVSENKLVQQMLSFWFSLTMWGAQYALYMRDRCVLFNRFNSKWW